MSYLPFFNKYPYTNFEQLNLDHLMSEVGTFDARIRSCEEKVTELDSTVQGFDGRLTQAESDISDIKPRLSTAEDDIDSLENRVGTAEDDIDSLEGRMQTAEGDIDAAEGDIDALEDRMLTAEGDIDALETSVSGINQVTANPAGAAAGTLNKVQIGSTIYNMPSGGGGSGTEVIANPGDPTTAALTKVSIDEVVYSIPPDLSSDVETLQGTVSDLDDEINTPGTGIKDNVSGLNSSVSLLNGFMEYLHVDVLSSPILTQSIGYFSTTSFPDVIVSEDYLEITTGTWIVFGYCETQVIPNNGSAYVSIEHGMSDENGNEYADTHSRCANVITFYNTTQAGTGPVYADFANSFMTVLTITGADNSLKLYLRQDVQMRDGTIVQSAGTSGKISAIRIR